MAELVAVFARFYGMDPESVARMNFHRFRLLYAYIPVVEARERIMEILIAASGFKPDRKLFQQLHRQAYPPTKSPASAAEGKRALAQLKALQRKSP